MRQEVRSICLGRGRGRRVIEREEEALLLNDEMALRTRRQIPSREETDGEEKGIASADADITKAMIYLERYIAANSGEAAKR